jgi:hypothetical protein
MNCLGSWFGLMSKGCCIGLPIDTIKWDNRQARRLSIIKAISVDRNAVRIGSRRVKGFHPANLAERMFGNACVETVAGERLFSANQPKPVLRDNKMHKPCSATDRTIALFDFDGVSCEDFKLYRAAMARARAPLVARVCHCMTSQTDLISLETIQGRTVN